MFYKASLLTSVLLAVLATAAPLPHQYHSSIPLRKRVSLTNADGTFDITRAIAQNVATINKHRQNLLNLQDNTGSLPQGWEIKPIATLPSNIVASPNKRQAEPLTDENDDFEWAGPISIGPRAQSFLIDFDTGSSDLWVPSASGDSSTIHSKNKYAASQSATSRKQNGTFSIQYGDGSTVSGPIYKDTVAVAGVTAVNQAFSAVTTVSPSFADDPIDGILGLAFPAISRIRANPFFITAYKQGKLQSSEFGFYLASSGSELYLGGTNSEKFSGSIEFHKIDASAGYWNVPGGSISVSSTKVVSGFDAIIDSGTTLMYGPPAAVASFYSKVPGAKIYDADNGFYSFPCNEVPDVSFSWGGSSFAISADNFNLGTTEDGASTCIGSLVAQDIGFGERTWLLGDSFMKNVYSVFSFEKNAVGFANLS